MRGLAASAALLALAACGNGGGSETVTATPGGPAFVSIDALDAEALTGDWSTASGDCAAPDFSITGDSGGGGLAVSAEFNGWDRTGRLPAGGDTLTFIDPTKRLPVRLEDGGLHIGPPADGLAVLGSRNIFEEGVIFRKCAGSTE